MNLDKSTVVRFGALLGVLFVSGVFVALAADGGRRLGEGIAEERTEDPFYSLPDPIPDGTPARSIALRSCRARLPAPVPGG